MSSSSVKDERNESNEIFKLWIAYSNSMKHLWQHNLHLSFYLLLKNNF